MGQLPAQLSVALRRADAPAHEVAHVKWCHDPRPGCGRDSLLVWSELAAGPQVVTEDLRTVAKPGKPVLCDADNTTTEQACAGGRQLRPRPVVTPDQG